MPKSETSWASVPGGKLKAAESKLWTALGDHGLNVITQLDDDDAYRLRVADFMIRGARLLRQLHTVSTSGYEKFIAAENFTRDNPTVRFWYFSDAFVQHFLGMVEENFPATELAVHRLERSAASDEIRAELGNRQKVALGQFYQFLATQESGWFLAFIRDARGTLWAVSASRDVVFGWGVDALAVTYPDRWLARRRVVSRK